jgi:glycosidase
LYKVFDYTYDYDGYEKIDKYFRGEENFKNVVDYIKIQQAIYPRKYLKMRFLENHDKPRIASLISSKERLKNWSVFYMLLPGSALIYAGQEIKSSKKPDLFEKTHIDWNEGDYEFLNFIKKIIKISKKIKSECTFFKLEEIKKGVVLFTWKGENTNYYIIINLEEKYGYISLENINAEYDLINEEKIELKNTFKLRKDPLIIKSVR